MASNRLRTVLHVPKFSRNAPILRSLYWLEINERIENYRWVRVYKLLTTSKLTTLTT